MFRATLPISALSPNPSAVLDDDRSVVEPASGVAVLEPPSLVTALSTRSWVGVLVLVVWVGSGLATAAVMARRGHELKTFAPLGVVVGPSLAGLAWSNSIAAEAEIEPVVLMCAGSKKAHELLHDGATLKTHRVVALDPERA